MEEEVSVAAEPCASTVHVPQCCVYAVLRIKYHRPPDNLRVSFEGLLTTFVPDLAQLSLHQPLHSLKHSLYVKQYDKIC